MSMQQNNPTVPVEQPQEGATVEVPTTAPVETVQPAQTLEQTLEQTLAAFSDVSQLQDLLAAGQQQLETLRMRAEEKAKKDAENAQKAQFENDLGVMRRSTIIAEEIFALVEKRIQIDAQLLEKRGEFTAEWDTVQRLFANFKLARIDFSVETLDIPTVAELEEELSYKNDRINDLRKTLDELARGRISAVADLRTARDTIVELERRLVEATAKPAGQPAQDPTAAPVVAQDARLAKLIAALGDEFDVDTVIATVQNADDASPADADYDARVGALLLGLDDDFDPEEILKLLDEIAWAYDYCQVPSGQTLREDLQITAKNIADTERRLSKYQAWVSATIERLRKLSGNYLVTAVQSLKADYEQFCKTDGDSKLP